VRSEIDPFATAKDWLSGTEVNGPVDDPAPGERRELAKHEELTAIHEDMAKLRTISIRRDIRTDAVDTAENWAIAAEFFDDETGQHCYRVGHLASMLAREIGMNETFCVQIEHAARLHDIGKIAVNEVILLKPGPLDAAEMAAMRLHTEVGAQILAGSDDPVLKMAVDVARHHHEWWNGAGYPTKISGRNIPLSARVCAYADVYDALTHMRAYKKAWTHERALEEIVRLGGTQFDPDLLGPFIAVLGRYRADLDAQAIPGFADMDSNALIASRRKLMETIGAGSP
jgi:putative two-component system response regulator